VELAGEVERFHERGLGLAAISYDSVAILKSFSERRQIPFPLLSDPDSEVIRAFGLLHPDYPEGHDLHGVPFPGTIVMDAEGRIVAKYFEESYRVRQTAASVFVREGDPGGGGRRLQAEHVSVTPSLSDATAVPGNRITLVLDLEMEPGHHAYAPGDHSYRGLTLNLEPDPLRPARRDGAGLRGPLSGAEGRDVRYRSGHREGHRGAARADAARHPALPGLQ
jgi:hypothetical protein